MRATKKMNEEDCDHELKRGPWTLEEDNLLIHYIARHGPGRWNTLAKSSGLKRTGKSCRLRWLNYLNPDIKHGNLSPQEQLLILDLHSKWGNRWSKIAQNLPGRTDNEIKNYWRTRVQKHARHLNIDSNSKTFVEVLRRFWMPRLLDKAEQTSSSLSPSSSLSSFTTTSTVETDQKKSTHQPKVYHPTQEIKKVKVKSTSSSSSDSNGLLLLHPQVPEIPNPQDSENYYYVDMGDFEMMGFDQSDMSALEFQVADADWMGDDVAADSFWNMDGLW